MIGLTWSEIQAISATENPEVTARREWAATLPETLSGDLRICRRSMMYTDPAGNPLLPLPKTGTAVEDLEAYFSRHFCYGEEE